MKPGIRDDVEESDCGCGLRCMLCDFVVVHEPSNWSWACLENGFAYYLLGRDAAVHSFGPPLTGFCWYAVDVVI